MQCRVIREGEVSFFLTILEALDSFLGSDCRGLPCGQLRTLKIIIKILPSILLAGFRWDEQ